MARLPRISPLGVPQHIIQRGNNRQVCFASERDKTLYVHWLAEYASQFDVSIHAWVLMSNQVYLLASPNAEGGVSNMRQALGRRYVSYFNREYQRSGTLWEGRFKSSLVQSLTYLLVCQLYIELNPVRAGLVKYPTDFVWSSYQAHALGKPIQVHSPHDEYFKLGKTPKDRQVTYRALFDAHFSSQLLTEIRSSLNKQMALGDTRFKDQIEALHGRRVQPGRMGRPVIDVP